jgi:hypothetical protein
MLPRLGEEYGVELVPVEALLSVPPHWTASKESQDSSVAHR